jgi:PKD repeat protein
MNRCLFFLVLLSGFVTSNATNISVSGTVSGSWNADTVFVNSNIELPYGKQLVIKPGCVVLFGGFYSFTIAGALTAIGNSSAIIQFKPKDTTGFSQPSIAGAWAGMIMGPQTSKLYHCRFQYMKGDKGIEISDSTQLRFCLLDHNRSGKLIYCWVSNVDVRNCVMAYNAGASVFGVSGRLYDTVKIENNTIVNNTGYAVSYDGYVRSALILTNNIFWNNLAPEIYHNPFSNYGFDTSAVILRNCIVRNGSQLPFYNETCFSQYPLFKDTASLDFSLQWEDYPANGLPHSIAINNGHYLSRRDPDSTRADIGAIPFLQPNGPSFTWVSFSMDSVLGYQNNHTVHFTNLSYRPNANTIWAWDFGDGTTSNLIEPVHTYSQSGTFTVKALAIDPNGHRDSIVLKNAITVLPGTRVNPGVVSGVWEKNKNPYYIYGDVFVPQDKRLELREGVELRFMGKYNLDVYGSLIARGNAKDSVRFVSNEPTGDLLHPDMDIDYPDADFQRTKGWGGIHVLSNDQRSDSCWLEYCRLSDVRVGDPNSGKYTGTLTLHHVKFAVIRNSLFANNFTTPQYFITTIDTMAGGYQGAGIAGVGTPAVIENNRFQNQYQFGPSCVHLTYADSVKLTNNQFLDVTNIAAAIEYVKGYTIENNRFDKVERLCLRLEDGESSNDRKEFNEIKGNHFSNSGRGVQASQQPRVVGGVYKIRFSNNVFRNLLSRIDVGVEAYGDSIYILNNLFYNNAVTREISNVGGTCLNVLLKNSYTGVVANNVFVNNTGFNGYQAIVYGDSALKICNNILRNRGGAELLATYQLSQSWFFANFSSSYHNNVKGGYRFGVLNFDDDPRFVDSAAQNFRLKSTSSSINKGYEDTTGLLLPSTDFYGNVRLDPYLKHVDVGAYEYISKRPTEIRLSSDTIQENLPPLTSIGGLTTIDSDNGDAHFYSFVTIPGVSNNNDEFTILGDSLYAKTTFQFAQGNKTVSIRTTDQFGAYLDSTFTIRLKQNLVTALPNILLSGEIRAYPNPVTDFLIVDAPNTTEGNWTICSIDGKALRSGRLKGKSTIYLSSLPKGSFLFKIATRRGTGSFIILKQ